MSVAPVLNFQEFIGIDGEQLTTDSLKVAQVHRKRHADVLRLIRLRMADAGEWGQRNFALSSYVSEQGKDVPVFTMTRDGYTFLVGKLTGRLATQHLIAFVMQDGKQLITDSRAVAIAFGKRHKNVTRTIDTMLANDRDVISEHARLNFEPCDYLAGNGRREPMYRMTAKGLSELAMSFTGDDAREVRIRFLDAFEEVAQRLLRADKTITDQLHALERREMPSKLKGQIGSKLMNERRSEKPEFLSQRKVLEALSQPALFQH